MPVTKRVQFLGPQGYGPYEIGPSGRPERLTGGVADTTLVPGFVDIHCHGGFGIDFMSADSEAMLKLCHKLRQLGYEGFLPTTVTASIADVTRALESLPEHEMIWGFHLEGPFISPKYPGAQPKQAIVEPPGSTSDWDTVLDDPRLMIVTLAPEIPGALDLVKRLAGRGVRVSIGHTDAKYAQAAAGFEAGADHTTHTFNAMRPLHHREAGTVGFALSQDELYAELIYDRVHVCREAAGILFRCKPMDRVVAISDSTMATGLPAGTKLSMWNIDVVVGDGDVRLTDGTLAGSAISVLDAFRNLWSDFGPETAIRACCLNPRQSIGRMEPPKRYVEFDRHLSIVDFHEVA